MNEVYDHHKTRVMFVPVTKIVCISMYIFDNMQNAECHLYSSLSFLLYTVLFFKGVPETCFFFKGFNKHLYFC